MYHFKSLQHDSTTYLQKHSSVEQQERSFIAVWTLVELQFGSFS